jgi:formylmethanofuran dehydrogenase subunit E
MSSKDVDPHELNRQNPGAFCSNCGESAGDAQSQASWTIWNGKIYCPKCARQHGVALNQ